MYDVAVCYEQGCGVAKNQKVAEKWFEDAAQEYLNMRKSKDIYLVIRIHDKTLAQEVIGYPEDDGATN